jgi:hypothetical protein
VNSGVNSLVNTGAMFWMTQGCGFRDGSRVQHLNRRAGIALRVISTTHGGGVAPAHFQCVRVRIGAQFALRAVAASRRQEHG